MAKRLIREPWVVRQRSQVGDDGELNAVFHVDHIAKAAKYVKAYRRKQFRPESLEKFRKSMRNINQQRTLAV